VLVPYLSFGWQIAMAGAAALLLASGLIWLLKPQGRTGRALVAAVKESGIVLALFAFWQLAGTLAHHSAEGAVRRGQRLLELERDLHIATEHGTQRLIEGHDVLAQACNIYYIYGHFNGLILFLAWIWFAHRSLYPSVRMSVVLLTAACFFVHLVTFAPPRLLPGAGFSDTAAQYGQSVYGPTTLEVADQLSAFPSVHVGWAAIIAWWGWRASPWRWGWVCLAHLVLTSFVVVATANHYWLDGLAAMAILAVALVLQATVPVLVRATRSRTEPAPPEPTEPAEEPALA
jgi:PAP2 superfamily protein